ncbi:MAG: NAD(P)/FAD-dependent oxidoreductase [Nonlabens sp.]
MKTSKKVHIIGAGVSGLAAAITLNRAGYKPIVLESDRQVGGRVQTDHSNHVIMDLGFQVMLDAYPAVQEFLDLKALNLVKFSPGSLVFKNGHKDTIGDPTRDKSFLFSTMFASVGSVKDKWKVFSLSRKLKQKSLQEIFETPETTTLQYLKDYGFSEKMIVSFFKPFYTGIFLETELETSSRMFEFVFKMFSEGSATLPKGGIQEIPKQMASRLDKDQLRLNTPVEKVVGNQIILKDGSVLESDYTIIATPAGNLIDNLPKDDMLWKKTTNLYFETDHQGFDRPIIGLIATEGKLANNFHFLQDIYEGHRNVLSVSVVADHQLNDKRLEDKVREELKDEAGIKVVELIKLFHIEKALPVLESVNYSMPPTETQLTEYVFLAGDQLSNGSLNAAMLNGKAAANAVIAKLEDRVII